MGTPDNLEHGMVAALEQARLGAAEGGIPIGAALVLDGRVVGEGHNRRVQQDDPVLHAEMDALRAAGRLRATDYRRATMFTTLSPCIMCAGAILLYRIGRVVIAENDTFFGEEEMLRRHGVQVENLELEEPKRLMRAFRARFPRVWDEDVGR